MLQVEDVVMLAAELVGARECVDRALSGKGDEADQSVCDAILRAYNMVESEIATDYAPIVCEQAIHCAQGKYEYDSLKRAPVYIIGVFDGLGRAVDVKLSATYFEVKNGSYTVRYAAFPVSKDIGDECELPCAISERTIAYGIAAEYCVQNGRYAENAVWEKKYKTALAAALKARGGMVMNARRWV